MRSTETILLSGREARRERLLGARPRMVMGEEEGQESIRGSENCSQPGATCSLSTGGGSGMGVGAVSFGSGGGSVGAHPNASPDPKNSLGTTFTVLVGRSIREDAASIMARALRRVSSDLMAPHMDSMCLRWDLMEFSGFMGFTRCILRSLS